MEHVPHHADLQPLLLAVAKLARLAAQLVREADLGGELLDPGAIGNVAVDPIHNSAAARVVKRSAFHDERVRLRLQHNARRNALVLTQPRRLVASHSASAVVAAATSPPACFAGLNSIAENSGVVVTAVNHDSISEISSTKNSDRQYSPVESSETPMAAKASMPTTVPPSSGHMVEPTVSRAAVAMRSTASARSAAPVATDRRRKCCPSLSIEQNDRRSMVAT